jgi:hypothetical protein
MKCECECEWQAREAKNGASFFGNEAASTMGSTGRQQRGQQPSNQIKQEH